MDIRRWDKKLADFLPLVQSGEVRIDKRYQRSGKVWPTNAKSYLVETVLMGFVLPRLLVHRVSASKGAPEYTAIIDGQQRTAALREFRNDGFALSAAVDRQNLRGKKYSGLSNTDKSAFDNYTLQMDRFEDATESDIREVFRRINSYTVPLNPEEQRHARFQGEFKWFLHRQGELYAEVFVSSGVLSEKQINRMADVKLLAEIVHATINGISTTSAPVLKRLYAEYDHDFDAERQLTRRLLTARNRFAGWGALPKSLQKHYHAYSLLLALLHSSTPIPGVVSSVGRPRDLRADTTIIRNLSTLAAVLESKKPDVPDVYLDLWEASEKSTNVKAARETRFRWYCRALTSDSI